MQYLIYQLSTGLVVISVNTAGEPQLSNDEDSAMTFTEDGATAFINDVLQPSGLDFWGARPVRKKPK